MSAGAASSEALVGSGGAAPKKAHSRGWQLVLALFHVTSHPPGPPFSVWLLPRDSLDIFPWWLDSVRERKSVCSGRKIEHQKEKENRKEREKG